jgi:hypothetical protein
MAHPIKQQTVHARIAPHTSYIKDQISEIAVSAPAAGMVFVSVEELAGRIRGIQDPVLRGRVQKALHLLHRTLQLYRCAYARGVRSVPCLRRWQRLCRQQHRAHWHVQKVECSVWSVHKHTLRRLVAAAFCVVQPPPERLRSTGCWLPRLHMHMHTRAQAV